jgi:hypothetical protein
LSEPQLAQPLDLYSSGTHGHVIARSIVTPHSDPIVTYLECLSFGFAFSDGFLEGGDILRVSERGGNNCWLNRTTRQWDTQAASCESASGEGAAARSAWTAAVTSGVE